MQTIEAKLNDANSPFVNISDHEKKINNVKKRFDRLQKKDPKKKLEEIYKDQSNVLKLIDQYRIDLKSSEEAIAQAKNTIVYQTLGLNKKITDDPEMLSFVNQSLSMCKALKPQVKEPKKTKVDHSGHNHWKYTILFKTRLIHTDTHNKFWVDIYSCELSLRE